MNAILKIYSWYRSTHSVDCVRHKRCYCDNSSNLIDFLPNLLCFVYPSFWSLSWWENVWKTICAPKVWVEVDASLCIFGTNVTAFLPLPLHDMPQTFVRFHHHSRYDCEQRIQLCHLVTPSVQASAIRLVPRNGKLYVGWIQNYHWTTFLPPPATMCCSSWHRLGVVRLLYAPRLLHWYANMLPHYFSFHSECCVSCVQCKCIQSLQLQLCRSRFLFLECRAKLYKRK